MGRRKSKEPEPEGCPLWVVTFGDAMSLLVTFFVMLVSFADFEEHSLQSMLGALKGGLRAVPLPMATAVGRVDAEVQEDARKKVVAADASVSVAESSQEVLREQPVKDIVGPNSPDYYLHMLKNGVSLMIRHDAAFKSGTAELVDSGHEVWQVAADLMHSVCNEVRITVTLPENVVVRLDGYTTSWGLGIEQALAVQKHLATKSRVDPRQMGTAVRVVKHMGRNEAAEGMIEILFIGELELEKKDMPRKILRGTWRERQETEGDRDDG